MSADVNNERARIQVTLDDTRKRVEDLVHLARQAELESVIAYLRRHDNDRLLGIPTPPLTELVLALERREHRR